MAADADLRARSERLDQLLRDCDTQLDAATRARVAELVHLLMGLHHDALERVLELAGDAAFGGTALVRQLAADALVGPVLLVHRLHPDPLPVRLAHALDALRPQVAARGCRAVLTAVDDVTAHVRLDGGAHVHDRAALERLIHEGLLAMAPELSAVVVDTGAPAAETPLLQILPRPQAEAGGRAP
jgi:hypothetical protein